MNSRAIGSIVLLVLAVFLPVATSGAEADKVTGIPKPDDAPKPMTPEESARAFQLPDGFRMEVVASEPLIASPSAVCWDERGRMFVSELHGYNLEGQLDIEELNKSGKLDTQVRRVQADEKFKQAAKPGTYGVVKLLLDTNGDGRMDRAVLWATNLPPAYGLVAARGGVIVACAPDIVFLADRDGDGVAETREVLFTGFRTGALERGINAPLWNVDGWIYLGRGHGGGTISGPHLASPVQLSDSDFRIRADGSAIEPVTGGTHTLGFAFTEAGERFVSTTSVPGIFIAPLPWQYLARNPDAATPVASIPTGDRHAYQISQPHPWRQKRAGDAAYAKFYRDRYGAAESDAGGWFTSACGAFVYQDNALPGLHGQYFVCEPSGNIIHRSKIETEGSALKLSRVPGEERSEFAASRDGWSHPIRLQHGPDGSIWVVDYYREIIEDYSAIPRHLQQQYGLYAGHDRGRIYRLTHLSAPKAPSPDMSSLNAKALAKETSSPLFWRRETAQRLLVERRASLGPKESSASMPSNARRSEDAAAASLLELLRQKSAEPPALITALHTLDQLGVLTPRDVQPFVSHADVAVRLHALRLGDKWFAKAEGHELLNATLAAASQEIEPRVALQFALSLGEARDPRSFATLARYARERLDIRWMDAALLSSLQGRGGEMLAELLREPVAVAPFLDKLAATIAARRDDAELARTLTAIRATTTERQAVILTSLAKGRANAKHQPLGDATASRELAALTASTSPAVRRAARLLEDTFVPSPPDEESIAGLPPPAPAVSDAMFRRYVAALAAPRDKNRGHELFLSACATCHRVGDEGTHFGPDLMGEVGMAEETLVRHLLLPSEHIRPGFETTLVETHAGTSFAGLLHEDGATSLTLRQPGGVEKVVLRKDVQGVRRAAVSLMPSFAESLQPADVANVLAWLRGNLKAPPPGRVMLFDEEPEFAAQLNEGGGRAEVVSTMPFSGALCLSITPPQRYSARINGWKFRIVEKPDAQDEFRYLRLAWRATGDGVMIELASNGQWPKSTDARRRYFSGKNTTEWQAHKVSATAPGEWREETLDLWRDCGAFTLTGIAPTAMGGTAFFDRIELMQEKLVAATGPSQSPTRSAALNQAARQYLGMIENFAGFAEQHWNEKEQSYDAQGSGVTWARGNGGVCLVNAVLLTEFPDRAEFSPKRVKREVMLDHTRRELRSLALANKTCTHPLARKPGTWGGSDGSAGGHWQAGLETEHWALAAHLLAAQLDDGTKALARQVASAEADLCIKKIPQAKPGNTAADDCAWNAGLLGVCAAMYADDSRAAKWDEWAKRWALNMEGREPDRQSRRVIDGKPLGEWLVVTNVFPDLTLENHGFWDLPYQVGFAALAEPIIAYHLCGRKVPEAFHANAREVGDQILKWLVMPDGDLLCPQGIDWAERDVQHSWAFSELGTFLDQPWARAAEARCLKLLTARQTVFGDGSIHALDFGYETDLAVVWTFSFLLHKHFGQADSGLAFDEPRGAKIFPYVATAVYRTPELVSSVTWFRSRQAIMISPNNLTALAERPAFTRYDSASGTGWIEFKGDKKRRAFRVRGEPRISQDNGTLTVSFAREIPGFVRQQISYCALPTGEVAVFSHWQALKDIEVTELVDHPFRWVAIEKFISKPDAKQTAPGVWTIDGKLQMQIFGDTPGEVAKDGINGAVRRNFSTKAGEVLRDSVCVYQPLVASREPREVKSDTNTLRIGNWLIQRGEGGSVDIRSPVAAK